MKLVMLRRNSSIYSKSEPASGEKTMLTVAILNCALLLGIVYASIFEWTLHKYLMHRSWRYFRYAFNAHARTHHKIFKADQSYLLAKEYDAEKISMAWWNGPVLVVIGMTPYYIAGATMWKFIGAHFALVLLGAGFFVCAGYYITYEYLHWCMHKPLNRPLERLAIFKWLNGHHLLHHKYMNANLNVVFPLADWIFGTLITRARQKFIQATGSAIPDVQPEAGE